MPPPSLPPPSLRKARVGRGAWETKASRIGCYEWPRQNFSSQYQYDINQIGDKIKEKYEFGYN